MSTTRSRRQPTRDANCRSSRKVRDSLEPAYPHLTNCAHQRKRKSMSPVSNMLERRDQENYERTPVPLSTTSGVSYSAMVIWLQLKESDYEQERISSVLETLR